MKILFGFGFSERRALMAIVKSTPNKEGGKEGCLPASPPTPSLAFAVVGQKTARTPRKANHAAHKTLATAQQWTTLESWPGWRWRGAGKRW